MANPDHLALLKKCIEAHDFASWNIWLQTERHNDNGFRPQLSKADLRGADLHEAYLHGADLGKATLNRADLRGANLHGADLSGACLYEADLRGSDLREAVFRAADLTRADLGRANLLRTVFADIDLSQVQGLETVRHIGPSTIGLDTFYKSQGNIPEAFLRGCGVPDEVVTFVRHQVGSANAIEFYSAFISHSTEDQEFANRLHADLQHNHVRVWYAPEDLKTGDSFLFDIDQAVHVYDKFLLILSENSVNSKWVKHEVEMALVREVQEDRRVLFPIRIDDAVMNCQAGWARQIHQSRLIGDFTRWKDHDEYQKAFNRLLRDLQTSIMMRG